MALVIGRDEMIQATAKITRQIHDPSVSFEEYLHFAAETRAWENSPANTTLSSSPSGPKAIVFHYFGRSTKTTSIAAQDPSIDSVLVNEKSSAEGKEDLVSTSAVVSDDEWSTAARAGRTASWGAVFFLSTTDILGSFSVPWAISQTGYGPGFALYTIFGAFAGYTGWQLWTMYMHLDSDRYPCKSLGDVAYRVFGPWARIGINILQVIQIIFVVAGVLLGGGQSIAQISKNSFCYIICIFIYAVAGMFVGQVRTLQRLGSLASLSVVLNVSIMCIVMGVTAHSAPNFQAAFNSFSVPKGPVITFAGTPPGTTFVNALNGLNQAVYSYGGNMLFCEFMSEMRRPADFWKAMICAQALIYTCYITFGMVVCSFQGQFAFNPAMQGLSPYGPQTATNVMFLFSGLIAATFYGNIEIKIIHANVFQELLHVPPLTTKRGKVLWVGLVPMYWSTAFLICAAIPQFSYISGLVSAVCILQFTYTIPPILMLGYNIKKSAILASEEFDVAAGTFVRIDGGMKRWWRGYWANRYANTFDLFFALGAATTAVLGIYSSVVSLKAGFDGKTVATSFGCTSPV